jgi:alpha-L-rhamnosidase
MLRKAFSVAPVSEHGAVTSARLYSSGLGWNEATVNGVKTDPTGWLNPGFTEYNDTVQYLTDDVTALIQQDATAARENVVASELGAGRYDSESRPSNHHFEDAQWRAEETLRADLYVKYADGTEQVVKSDDTWQTSIDGPIRYNDFDTGETYDARQQLPGWDTASQSTAGWASARTVLGPKGKLIAQKHERTALVDNIKGPFPRWTISPGVYGFDTLKQRAGWATVKIWGAERGQVIRVFYVERRNNDATLPGPQDGALAPPGNLQQQYYVSDGTGTEANPEVFTQKFNFSGFQWVQIAGSNGEALPEAVKVDVDSVQEVRTNLPEVGEFSASSPLLNVIHTAVKGSVAGNHMAGYMMDTPTYEKDGWSGDTQLAAPVASLIFDTQRQWQKSAIDVVDSQLKQSEYPDMEGQVGFLIPGSTGYGYCSQAQPVTAANQWACANGSLATASTAGPSVNVFKNANGGASPIWDAMLHVLPWEAYNRYGDTYGLRTAYDAMKLYLDVTMEKWRKAPDYTPPSGSTEDDHTVTSFLGDWSFPTGGDGNAAEATNVNATAITNVANTAYYAYISKLTADSARVLGKSDEAAKYDALHARIKRDFNARFWDEARGYYVDPVQTAFMSQAVQVLALGIDLVPAERKRALQEKLVNDVLVTRTGHQLTGIASARWIYPVLTEAAHAGVPNAAKAAYAAAQQTTYPSYGYWFTTLGFTGVGENWEQGTRTRNHEMFGTIAQWFYEDVAGIKNLEPGFKKIQIRPLITPDGIASASAAYDSVHGEIKSSWEQSAAGIKMHVTIPANTTARVYVPGSDAGKIGETGSGQALLAKYAPGVTLVGVEQDAVVFEVGSGSYTFVTGDGRFAAVETPGTVGGTVPATLSLSLGTPASFGALEPGVAKEYTASTTANVISTAGDAALSVSDPGHLTNGAFSLPEPLRVEFAKARWTAPVSNDAVGIAFKQLVKATDPLRTGSYSKTLTFTLSTTTP